MAGEVIPLGTRLRQRREELGLSQAQVARELDVARTAYRLWEMEAARPAPDRWRAIAQWLGISVTAMLLAAELLSDDEAFQADRSTHSAGHTGATWDAQSAESDADFFSQERAMIADQAFSGTLTGNQADTLRTVLSRIQQVTSSEAVPARWHPGRFRKRVPNTDLAPAVARAALVATAIGIPDEILRNAMLLTSELITNSVKHTDSTAVDVDISVDANCLRIEVGDEEPASLRPRTPDLEGGWGFTLIGQLATRWGVERLAAGKAVWIEFDLTTANEPTLS